MKDVKISLDNAIIKIAYIYIALPIIIFILGWIKWQISIPAVLAIVYGVFLAIREDRSFEKRTFAVNKKKLVGIILFIAMWLFFSGICGFGYQQGDFQYRNTIFSDIITHKWPVLYHFGNNPDVGKFSNKETMLTYYIGFWFPAALFGKAFGVVAGRVFLYLWALLGISMVIYLVFRYLNKISFRMLLMILFLGNIYVIGMFHYFPLKEILTKDYAIWANGLILTDSITSTIYSTFNQTIVPLLIFTLILNKISSKNVLFLYSFAFLHGPFSFVGIAPFILCLAINQSIKDKDNIAVFIKKHISIQAIIALIIIIPITYLYFASNNASKHIAIVHQSLKMHILFAVLSFGVISALLFPKYKKDPMFYIAFVMFCILPFIQLGYYIDFSARVSIPAQFIFILLTIRLVFEEGFSKLKPLLIIYICIASITPLLQTGRSIYYTAWYAINQQSANKALYEKLGTYDLKKVISDRSEDKTKMNYLLEDDLKGVDDPLDDAKGNFMSFTDSSVFYKYMAKHN